MDKIKLKFKLIRPYDLEKQVKRIIQCARSGREIPVCNWEVIEELVRQLQLPENQDCEPIFSRYDAKRTVAYGLEEITACIRHNIECR